MAVVSAVFFRDIALKFRRNRRNRTIAAHIAIRVSLHCIVGLRYCGKVTRSLETGITLRFFPVS